MYEPKFTTQPLYVQLREALMQRITSGDWRPGVAIPNEIDIAREYGLSAGTVRKALDWMEQANLVVRQQGRGTFVRDPSAQDLAHRYESIRSKDGSRLIPQFGETSIAIAEANAYECDWLKLKPGTNVRRITQLRMSDEKPYMLEMASLPLDLFPKVPEAGYTITGAAWESGVLLGKAEERVHLDTANEAVAAKLGLSPGAKVLKLDRVVHSIDGRPAEWRVAHCCMGDLHYVASLGSL